jgi:hypothetical protein
MRYFTVLMLKETAVELLGEIGRVGILELVGTEQNLIGNGPMSEQMK